MSLPINVCCSWSFQSPQIYFNLITRHNIYRINVSQKILIWFWEQNHCCQSSLSQRSIMYHEWVIRLDYGIILGLNSKASPRKSMVVSNAFPSWRLVNLGRTFFRWPFLGSAGWIISGNMLHNYRCVIAIILDSSWPIFSGFHPKKLCVAKWSMLFCEC